MLLHSYYDFNYILRLPLKNVTKLLIKASEKQIEDKIYQRWILKYDDISFDEFKNKLIGTRVKSDKSEQEILTDVKDIINTFNKEVK